MRDVTPGTLVLLVVIMIVPWGCGSDAAPTEPGGSPSPSYPPSPLTPSVDHPLAFADADGQLGIRRTNGATQTLVSDTALSIRSLLWSPRADWIAMIAATDTAPGTPAAIDLYVVDSTGAGLTKLSDVAHGVSGAAWAPDNGRLVFTTFGGEMWIVRRDGTDARQITSVAGNAGHPIWSPDGIWILHSGEADAKVGVLKVRATDADLTLLAETDRYPRWPSRFNPDGTRILFDDVDDIGVMNADGGERGFLTGGTDSEDHARWSPDGRYVAYVRGSFTGPIEISVPGKAGRHP
jgi:Tol biopolymer transport system component